MKIIFYRKATLEEVKKRLEVYKLGLPLEFIELMDSNQDSLALKILREKYYLSLLDAKKTVQEYRRLLQVSHDIQSGEVVYTNY